MHLLHCRSVLAKLEEERLDVARAKSDIIPSELLVTRKAGEEGKLYGSVTAKEIQSFLAEKNVKFSIDDIQIDEPIKSIGKHFISINPYDDLSKKINIIVNKIKEK